MTNKGTPLVSVHCATYNHGRYIKDALEGFVSQRTNFPFEVFVHDDASTDSTARIIREYAERFPSLIVPILQEENQRSKGIPILRTHVLPKMRGRFIAFCEGDDYWCDDGKLQMQVDCLESQPEAVACVHNTEMVGSEGNRLGYASTVRKSGMLEMSALVRESGAYHTSSLMCRKSYYEQPIPEFVSMTRGVGDYPMRLALAFSGGIYYLDRVMSVYRFQVEGSWSARMARDSAAAAQTRESVMAMLEGANEYSNHEHSELFEWAIKEQRYALMDLRHEWKDMMSSEMRTIRATKPLRHRARIALSAINRSLGEYLAP